MNGLKIVRYALWALVVVVVAAVGFVSFNILPGSKQADQSAGVADVGGPFELTAMSGDRFSSADLEGAPYAIFFGFTFCPDVCPTSLYELSTWLDQLGGDAEDVKAIFVSVDPERDTPEVLENYMSAFGERIVGLTGTTAEIDKVARDHRVYYKRVDLDDGDYTMDHTASIFLFRGDGSFFGTIAYGENADSAKAKLTRLAKT